MLMMGYFRAPKLGGRRSSASSPERDGGQSLRAALLLDGGEAAAGTTVPKGYFAVYVGAEARRFVVPMSLLCQPAFRELMERAAEEFGFGQAGGLRIPCREEDFVATVAELLPSAAESRQRRRSAAAGGRRQEEHLGELVIQALPNFAVRPITIRGGDEEAFFVARLIV